MKDELDILQPSLQEQLQVHTALHLEYQAELAAEKQRRPSHKEHMRQILEWIEVTVAPDIYQAALVEMLSSKGDEDFWMAPLSTRDILRGLQKTIGCSEEQDKSGVLGRDEVPLEGMANTIEAIRFAERYGLVRVPSRKPNSNLADNACAAQDGLSKRDDDDTAYESEQDATEAPTVPPMVPGSRQATVSNCASDDEHRSKDVSTYERFMRQVEANTSIDSKGRKLYICPCTPMGRGHPWKAQGCARVDFAVLGQSKRHLPNPPGIEKCNEIRKYLEMDAFPALSKILVQRGWCKTVNGRLTFPLLKERESESK